MKDNIIRLVNAIKRFSGQTKPVIDLCASGDHESLKPKLPQLIKAQVAGLSNSEIAHVSNLRQCQNTIKLSLQSHPHFPFIGENSVFYQPPWFYISIKQYNSHTLQGKVLGGV